jgi:hypothetical protein
MKEHPPNKLSPIWRSDVPGLMVVFIWPLLIVIPAAMLWPGYNQFRQLSPKTAFAVAVGVGALGIICLFLARLPLYRRRQFFAFGPRQLDATHRKLYWLAYCFAGISVVLLLDWLAL